ncbi:MAG: LD-carboxypeptidase [Desulfobacteraceae bacterium]|nr:LD-carboxypeptidase [Desulfobacteraceae bacterium]
MRTHYNLKPGDSIGICAPSGSFDAKKFEKGVQALKDMGFDVIIPSGIYEKKRYLAGDDRLRADIVNTLFANQAVKAIICARGGYGSMRILDLLDFHLIQNNPKPIVGFSDNTALLIALINRVDLKVIHGPNVVSLSDAQQATIESLLKALTLSRENTILEDGHVIKAGRCTGVLSGGNIATIVHLIGTRFQPDFKNAVLFLEDIGEPAYKIDRMLTQMKMAGMFDRLTGVVTGSFENCDNEKFIYEIIEEVFNDFNIPVLSGLDAGHGAINLSLPMGVEVEMDATKSMITWKQ